VQLMGEVVAAQRFGMGTLKRAAVKGGWGPVSNGYLTTRMAAMISASRASRLSRRTRPVEVISDPVVPRA